MPPWYSLTWGLATAKLSTMAWIDENADSRRERKKKDLIGWIKTYELLFHQSLARHAFLEGKDVQQSGIDRIVKTRDGQTHTVQEKDRRNVWDDILIEWRHRRDNGQTKRGWGFDSGMASMLCYVMWPDRDVVPIRAYLIDYTNLATWFVDEHRQLHNTFGCKSSRSNNTGYATDNIPLPLGVLYRHDLVIAEAHPWLELRHERLWEQ